MTELKPYPCLTRNRQRPDVRIGIGQIAVIFLGLAVLRWEGRAHAREHADCHAEAMTALRVLIERTALPKE